jgi:hypothetical protein
MRPVFLFRVQGDIGLSATTKRFFYGDPIWYQYSAAKKSNAVNTDRVEEY